MEIERQYNGDRLKDRFIQKKAVLGSLDFVILLFFFRLVGSS